MKFQDELIINRYAQGLESITPILNMFIQLSLDEQREFLIDIINLIIQSKSNDQDIDEAIKLDGLKSTFTPCVLAKKRGIKSLYDIVKLPSDELNKTLVLFLNIFKLAYLRRYNVEKNHPDKWWYWDLSKYQPTK